MQDAETNLKNMDKNLGQITKMTADFEESCKAILERQSHLSVVSDQIRSHLKNYEDFE